ncbi:tryptophan 7-halogenase, partial [Caulobacter sp.]|uniref:tryptophan 7-halogenase n=1 Tax=Caulobacter sp. TaxID=78 RepID=UPI001B1BD0E2
WQACREMTLPDSLTAKMDLWRARGAFLRYRWEMFHPASWLAIYGGFEHDPDRIDPALAAVDPAELAQGLAQIRAAVARAVADTPTHSEFLATVDGVAAEPMRTRA